MLSSSAIESWIEEASALASFTSRPTTNTLPHRRRTFSVFQSPIPFISPPPTPSPSPSAPTSPSTAATFNTAKLATRRSPRKQQTPAASGSGGNTPTDQPQRDVPFRPRTGEDDPQNREDDVLDPLETTPKGLARSSGRGADPGPGRLSSFQSGWALALTDNGSRSQNSSKNRKDDIFTNRPALPPSSATSSLSSTTASRQSASAKRSRSPAKSASRLRLARVDVCSLDTVELSPSVQDLLDSLIDIGNGIEVVPQCAQDGLTSLGFRHRIRAHNVTRDYHLPPDAASSEFSRVLRIVRNAQRCDIEGEAEASWNARVHDPLLEVALEGYKGGQPVQHWNTTSASIIPSLIPGATGAGRAAPLGPRLVDYCLTIEPTMPPPSLGTASDVSDTPIARLLAAQPENLRTVNQTAYDPLILRPIGLSIETKTERSPELGREQLAVWTRAWLDRIRMFEPSSPSATSSVPPPPVLPLLRVVGHSWYFLLAWENSDGGPGETLDTDGVRRLIVAGEVQLGDTRSPVGVYKLLGAVRRLAAWMDGEFRQWFDGVVERSTREPTVH